MSPFLALSSSIAGRWEPNTLLVSSFKASAAEACDQAFMSRLSASLDDLDMFSDDQDDLAAIILESAHA